MLPGDRGCHATDLLDAAPDNEYLSIDGCCDYIGLEEIPPGAARFLKLYGLRNAYTHVPLAM